MNQNFELESRFNDPHEISLANSYVFTEDDSAPWQHPIPIQSYYPVHDFSAHSLPPYLLQEQKSLGIQSKSDLHTLYSVNSPEFSSKSKADKVFNRLIHDVNRRTVARKNLDELSKIMKIEQDEKLIGPKKKIDRDHAEIVFKRLTQDASDRNQSIELRNALRKIDEHNYSSPKIKLDSKVNAKRITSLIEYGKQTQLKIEAARRAKEIKLIEELQTNLQKLHPKRKQDPQTWKRLQMIGNTQNRQTGLTSQHYSSKQLVNPYPKFTQSKSSKHLVPNTKKDNRVNKPNMRKERTKESYNEFSTSMDVSDYMKKKLLEIKSARVSMRPSVDLIEYEPEQTKSNYKPADAVSLMIPNSKLSIRNFTIESQEIGNIIPKPYNSKKNSISSINTQINMNLKKSYEDIEVPSSKILIPTLNLSKLNPDSGLQPPNLNTQSITRSKPHDIHSISSTSFEKTSQKNSRPTTLSQDFVLNLTPNLIERLERESSPPEPEPGASIPTPISHPDFTCILPTESCYEDSSNSSIESPYYPSKTVLYSKLSKSIPNFWDTLESIVNIKDIRRNHI